MTGRDIVTASLRKIGALAAGETLEAHEAADGLAELNRMLGSWSNERLLIHAGVREEFTLTSGTGSYTIGTGANFNTSRPVAIEAAAIEDQTATPTVEIPMRILRTQDEWAAVLTKDADSDIPTHLYADGTFPNDTLNLYPVPSAANKLVLYSRKALTALATLDAAVSFPPGYDDALIYNLAIRLAPEYGKTVPDAVGIASVETKAAIKRANYRSMIMTPDAVPAGGSSYFDIMTGEYR